MKRTHRCSGDDSQEMTESRREAAAIGRGLPLPVVENAREELSETPRDPFYDKYENQPFIFEVLQHKEVSKQVVDVWVQVCATDIRAVLSDILY